MKKQSFRFALPIALASIAPLQSYSAVTVTVQEFGSDVFVSASGSINLNALTSDGSSVYDPIIIAPQISYFTTGTAGTGDAYTGASGPSSFGTGGFAGPSTSTGALFGIIGGLGQIVVPENYISNDPISSTSIYAGQSFASLGIAQGTYEWTWGTGGDADSATINVVPESSTYALILGGLVFAGIALNRRRRKA